MKLASGLNKKSVTVKAQNGAVKVYALNITRAKPSKVRVAVSDLNMRTGPGTVYKSKGKIPNGVYTIVQTKNGWGKLEKNGYWIKLSYTTKVKPKTYKVRVKVTELNMRTGPGTRYKSKGAIRKGTYRITRTKNGWGKLKKNGYWIKLSYTKRV